MVIHDRIIIRRRRSIAASAFDKSFGKQSLEFVLLKAEPSRQHLRQQVARFALLSSVTPWLSGNGLRLHMERWQYCMVSLSRQLPTNEALDSYKACHSISRV
jgi:hypothetical protein